MKWKCPWALTPSGAGTRGWGLGIRAWGIGAGDYFRFWILDFRLRGSAHQRTHHRNDSPLPLGSLCDDPSLHVIRRCHRRGGISHCFENTRSETPRAMKIAVEGRGFSPACAGIPSPPAPLPLAGEGDHEGVGEGLCGGASAPPFRGFPVSSTQAIFMHSGEPEDHAISARDDSLGRPIKRPGRGGVWTSTLRRPIRRGTDVALGRAV
jgi:hypothetical protein